VWGDGEPGLWEVEPERPKEMEENWDEMGKEERGIVSIRE
jgi:hypothetical protein